MNHEITKALAHAKRDKREGNDKTKKKKWLANFLAVLGPLSFFSPFYMGFIVVISTDFVLLSYVFICLA